MNSINNAAMEVCSYSTRFQSSCRFHLRMRTVLMDNLAQAGYCLYMNYASMFCEHVYTDHAYWPHYPIIVTLNILVKYNIHCKQW